jgi:hypothetical protein
LDDFSIICSYFKLYHRTEEVKSVIGVVKLKRYIVKKVRKLKSLKICNLHIINPCNFLTLDLP